MRILALGFACCCLAVSAADVYRWVDKDGVVHYSDKPLSPDAKQVALPPLQTYKSGTPPPGFSDNAPAPGTGAAAAAAAPISITSPADQDTVRDGEGKLNVAVAANPGPGQGLIYYLDGAAQNVTPTPSTEYLYTGVERGQHSVSAALVARPGAKELARAPPGDGLFHTADGESPQGPVAAAR